MSALVKTLTFRFNKAQGKNVVNKTYKNLSSSCGSQQPTETNPKYSNRMIKFKKLQEQFQRDDGKPIFLKRGPMDRLLYLSTIGLGILGLILDLKYYAGYIFDEKK